MTKRHAIRRMAGTPAGYNREAQRIRPIRHRPACDIRKNPEGDGEIAKLFRIAQTATRPEERRTFKELLAFARKNAHWLSRMPIHVQGRTAEIEGCRKGVYGHFSRTLVPEGS